MYMEKMRNQLVKLLSIHATSGNEKPVRDYLAPVLTGAKFTAHCDAYGNLLGHRQYGNGKGATILLSAHMDTVKGVVRDREIIEKDGIIRSSKGALGADDRAGIAIILEVLRNLEDMEFNGNVKVAFSREEEVGCIGASRIKDKWYKDVDLAIVVDRKGNRDIVVGCGQAFCSDSVGMFLEEVSKMVDMDWKCTEGGISDAMVFSENGVNSVNLSCGYMNEHTDKEFVVLNDMKDTVKLMLQTFAVINQFYDTFEEPKRENKWVEAWYPKNKDYDSYASYYEDMFLDEPVWAEEQDANGDVYVYEVGNQVVISQGDQEIMMSKGNLSKLVDQLMTQV